MDVLLLCCFQKERTYEQKGRTGEEVKSILYIQQRHIKTTHVGQKMRDKERESAREIKKNRKKNREKDRATAISINRI